MTDKKAPAPAPRPAPASKPERVPEPLPSFSRKGLGFVTDSADSSAPGKRSRSDIVQFQPATNPKPVPPKGGK